MVVKMKANAAKEDVESVCNALRDYGIKPDTIFGAEITVIGMVGDESKVDVDHIKSLSGVSDVVLMQSEVPYKLVSRKYNPSDVLVEIGDVIVGGDRPVYFVGPCSVESRDQFMRISEKIKKISEKDSYGQYVLRGGAFKPRNNACVFQGLKEEGLKILAEARKEFCLPVVTEVIGEKYVDICAETVDALQIGTKNMYNQELLMDIGKTGMPVLYKRHFGASIQDWLQHACHIVSAGDGDNVNKNVIFCERGIASAGKGKEFTRYPIDMSSVPVVKTESYFPIVVDPSHSAGRRDFIADYALSAIGMGAHGLMIETHDRPGEALTDGPQMVTPDELSVIIGSCNDLYAMRREYRSRWEAVSRTGNEKHVAYR